MVDVVHAIEYIGSWVLAEGCRHESVNPEVVEKVVPVFI
jgi:hypothetical protein